MKQKSDYLFITAVRNGFIIKNSFGVTSVENDEKGVGTEIGNSFTKILNDMHENETIKVEFNVYGTEDEN